MPIVIFLVVIGILLYLRMERDRQRYGWKESTSFQNSFISNRSNVPRPVGLEGHYRSISPNGKMLYFLCDDQVGGSLFYPQTLRTAKV